MSLTARPVKLRAILLGFLCLGCHLPLLGSTNFCAGTEEHHLDPRSKEYSSFRDKVLRLRDYNVGCELPGRIGSGDKLMHAIAMVGDSDLLMRLIMDGADMDVRNSDGDTPLIVAISKGRVDATNAASLILLGADVNARGNDGLSALDIVRERRKTFERFGITSGTDYRRLLELEEGLITHGARSSWK